MAPAGIARLRLRDHNGNPERVPIPSRAMAPAGIPASVPIPWRLTGAWLALANKPPVPPSLRPAKLGYARHFFAYGQLRDPG
jgi:hypothetical protein